MLCNDAVKSWNLLKALEALDLFELLRLARHGQTALHAFTPVSFDFFTQASSCASFPGRFFVPGCSGWLPSCCNSNFSLVFAAVAPLFRGNM